MLAAAQLGGRLQILSIALTLGLFLLVFELVRQRRLMERYALLWLFSAVVLLALAIWQDALTRFSSAVGIATPSNALFAVALGFVIVLLLHFSLVISRLADQNKVLAQRIGALNQRVDELQAERDHTGS
ncbi:MAG: DUF2304 domain-containing protein [Baekduia sp.]